MKHMLDGSAYIITNWLRSQSYEIKLPSQAYPYPGENWIGCEILSRKVEICNNQQLWTLNECHTQKYQ